MYASQYRTSTSSHVGSTLGNTLLTVPSLIVGLKPCEGMGSVDQRFSVGMAAQLTLGRL